MILGFGNEYENLSLFFPPPHMGAVGAIVSLQSFLLVICDQISLCNDIA